MEEKTQKIYEYLQSQNVANLPDSYEAFSERMSTDEGLRGNVFNYLSDKGVKNFPSTQEEFDSFFLSSPNQSQPTSGGTESPSVSAGIGVSLGSPRKNIERLSSSAEETTTEFVEPSILEVAKDARQKSFNDYVNKAVNEGYFTVEELSQEGFNPYESVARKKLEQSRAQDMQGWGPTQFRQGANTTSVISDEELIQSNINDDIQAEQETVKEQIISAIPEAERTPERLEEVEEELWQNLDMQVDLTGEGRFGTGKGFMGNVVAPIQKGTEDMMLSTMATLAEGREALGIPDVPMAGGIMMPTEDIRGTRKQRMDELAKRMTQYRGDILDNLMQGNFSNASGLALQQTGESLPLMLAASTGNAAASFLALSGLSANKHYQDVRDESWFKDLNNAQQLGYLAGYGGAEGLDLVIGGMIIKNAAKSVNGKNGLSARAFLQDFFKGMGYDVGEEALSEGVTGVAQYALDQAAQGKDITMSGIEDAFVRNSVAGAAGAPIMRGVGVTSGYAKENIPQLVRNTPEFLKVVKQEKELLENVKDASTPQEVEILSAKAEEVAETKSKLFETQKELLDKMTSTDLEAYSQAVSDINSISKQLENVDDKSPAVEIGQEKMADALGRVMDIKAKYETDAIKPEAKSEETVEEDVQETEQPKVSEEIRGEDTEGGETTTEGQTQEQAQEEVKFTFEEKGRPKERVKNFITKWFGSQRTKSKEEIYQLNKDRQGKVASELKKVENTSADLRRLVNKEAKDSGSKSELYNTINQVLRGEAEVSELSPEVAEVVQSMRNQIDALTRESIDLGIVPDKLVPVFEEGMGNYLTRSYRAFDDVNWPSKIPQEVRVKAFDLLRDQYRDEVKKEVLKENPQATEAQINESLENRVKNKMEELLDRDKSFVAAASNIAGKDLSALKARKDISPEIRALLGEYNDPIQNYAKSVFKMASFASSGKFLNELKDVGEGVFLFEKNDPNRPAGYSKQIATEGSETLSPLNGLYTTPEIAEQLQQTVENVPDWLNVYLTAMSAVKYTKTILSATTHIKNVLGNIGFLVMGSNLSPNGVKNAYKSVLEGNGFTKKGDKWKLEDSDKFRKKYEEYQKLGVVSQSTGVGEIRDLINQSDIDNFLFEKQGENKLQRGWSSIKRGLRRVENAYQAEDDFFKVLAFENELSTRSEALYGKPKEELNTEEYNQLSRDVADIIRDTYPTYDMVPDVVDIVRKFPVLGTFVSFQAEAIRVFKNNIQIAAKDLSSENPEVRKLGAKRMAGIFTYATLKAGIIKGFMALAGVSDEEDKDMRFFMPPWMKNGDLIYLTKKDGGVVVFDLSSSDPFGSTYSALNSLKFFGRDVLEDPSKIGKTPEALINAFKEQFSAFLAEDILTAKVREAASNVNSFGGQVYNPEESLAEQAKDLMVHFYDALEPGTIKSIRRYFDPKKDFKTELAASFLGIRAYDIDFSEQFGYDAREYAERLSNAGRGYRSATYKDLPKDELGEEYQESNESVKKLLNELSERYQAAQRLGVSKKELDEKLKDARVKSDYIRQISSGVIKDEQDLGGKKPKSSRPARPDVDLPEIDLPVR